MRPQILIAEDDTALRNLFAKVFDYAGFDVACANDGYQAMAQLTTEQLPSAVLLDINMPGYSGWEIMEQLNERDCLDCVRTVIVTANPIAAEAEQAQYADLVLIKPLDAYDLLDLAEQLMGKVI